MTGKGTLAQKLRGISLRDLESLNCISEIMHALHERAQEFTHRHSVRTKLKIFLYIESFLVPEG